MKKIIIVFLMLFLSFGYIARAQDLKLIPQPAEVNIGKGTLTLTESSTITYSADVAKPIAYMLARQLEIPTGFTITPQKGTEGIIQLVIASKPIAKIGNEGYRLEITAQKVVIEANQAAGLFYGMQTLLQLLPKEVESKKAVNTIWSIPTVSITDYPRFAWRGLMLDVSRNFFKKEDVKAYIDLMARFKFNTFHWHLTDDNGWRIEIKSLPKLTEVGAWRVDRAGQFGSRKEPQPGEKATYGGYYTHEDIREIVKYAQERNVTIIPEIDIPGHSMAAIASYPELCVTKDTSIKVNPGTSFADWYGNGTFKVNIDNTLNPSDEKVYVFLDKVFTEVAQLFPNPYIHVGGDECYKGFWKNDSACRALMKKLSIRHVEDLQGYFMGRVETILKSKGKKMLGWDEILEGGVSKDAAIMCWRDIKIGTEAAKEGYKVVMSPTAFAYLDYIQGESTIEAPVYASLLLKKCYAFEPAPEKSGSENILGGQGNLWSEQIPTLRYAQYMTYPRAWALAEVLWSKSESKNWDNFIRRVENQFERFDVAEFNYAKSIYDIMVSGEKKDGIRWITMQTEAPGIDIYYTIDGTMPDNHALKYNQPFALPDGQITIRAVGYRDSKRIGNLIILRPVDIQNRIW